jgi:signal transduction histidine kinase
MWERVVLNLLSNAFKFTFEGEITVTIRARDGLAEFIVRDTGTGIPRHELSRLFERFHRIEDARGRSFEGSGIGLALVYELVKLHGGNIRVESEEERGSAFITTVPFGAKHLPSDRIGSERSLASTAVRAHAYVEEAQRWLPGGAFAEETVEKTFAKPLPELAAAPAGERAHVLLADDNADMRDYVSRLLGGRHEVESVRDGQAALETLRNRPPDLVLTDILMPKLDGFALIRAIRKDTKLRDLPIIVLSARAGEEANVEGLSAGADDYVVKPFSARELIARVDRALAMARLRRQMSEELRALNETLEQRVAEEVARRSKAEDELRQAQKMEAIGHLTGGLAHDFNNLLTIVVGSIDSLQRHFPPDAPDTLQRAAENAMQGAKRAVGLTQRLLAISRRQPLESKPTEVNRLVAGMSDLLVRTLGGNIEVETVLADGLWRVEVDPNQLESTLLNLAVNARDAMPKGGKLTIETANAHPDELHSVPEAEALAEYVVLAVSDTGSGMSHEVLARAFEPFFTTKPTGHGTGLGLSQVFGLVKQWGGHVKLYSELGRGTTVKIYLPRLMGSLRDKEEVGAATGPDGRRGETIPLVDDN